MATHGRKVASQHARTDASVDHNVCMQIRPSEWSSTRLSLGVVCGLRTMGVLTGPAFAKGSSYCSNWVTAVLYIGLGFRTSTFMSLSLSGSFTPSRHLRPSSGREHTIV